MYCLRFFKAVFNYDLTVIPRCLARFLLELKINLFVLQTENNEIW